MPISCHFRDCKALPVTRLIYVSIKLYLTSDSSTVLRDVQGWHCWWPGAAVLQHAVSRQHWVPATSAHGPVLSSRPTDGQHVATSAAVAVATLTGTLVCVLCRWLRHGRSHQGSALCGSRCCRTNPRLVLAQSSLSVTNESQTFMTFIDNAHDYNLRQSRHELTLHVKTDDKSFYPGCFLKTFISIFIYDTYFIILCISFYYLLDFLTAYFILLPFTVTL